jgi:hypothetical protein
MDDELEPSESNDSEATEDPRVVGHIDMNRMLDIGFKWICVGKSLETGQRAIFLSPDPWDVDELYGFISKACTPEFILPQLNTQPIKDGDGDGR